MAYGIVENERATNIMYLAACVTGNAATLPSPGLIKPSKHTINPIGNTSETAPIVSKFVMGAIIDT